MAPELDARNPYRPTQTPMRSTSRILHVFRGQSHGCASCCDGNFVAGGTHGTFTIEFPTTDTFNRQSMAKMRDSIQKYKQVRRTPPTSSSVCFTCSDTNHMTSPNEIVQSTQFEELRVSGIPTNVSR
ncbi:hypothetical protein T265_10315 [Opisthorchis viverrini]|uniref:Uncharacterized protein n=1 Tax=Opisthorchis viverrini TaxID=6198 RepID=A0A074Z2X2_OPIVI|nr:hypothetical protein T265_10315 [Opisthorchis viverrini]KER21343.1 hypothetical protein T265_10315 [Opisthorchis viverrini]